MNDQGTRIIVDPNYTIILPPGQNISPEQIQMLLSTLPQLEVGQTKVCLTDTSATPLSDGTSVATFSTPQVTAQAYTSEILTPISPNVLTPENSHVTSPTCTTTTPKAAKGRFLTHFDESPITSLSSPQISKSANPSSKVTSGICSQLPVTNPAVNPFGTLVFFDCETTGLGHQIGKSNVHITEISLVAFERNEFWQSRNSELKEIRIISKLSMCVRPRQAVSPGAAKITGLDSYNLVNQYPFDKNAATAIISFLSRLPKPVCLLAHNGNAFDFPLLKAEFKRLSMELPSDLLIADTLVAFRTIGIVDTPSDRKVCKSVKYGSNGRLSHSLDNLHLFFFNKKPCNAHTSEGDCLALAKVCHKLKENALPWLEANAKTMDTVNPMW